MNYNYNEKRSEYKGSKQEKLNKLDLDETEGLHGKLGKFEARGWYLAQADKIQESIDKTMSLKHQAMAAHELRNALKLRTRDMMRDQGTRKHLDRNRPLLSFDQYVKMYMV